MGGGSSKKKAAAKKAAAEEAAAKKAAVAPNKKDNGTVQEKPQSSNASTGEAKQRTEKREVSTPKPSKSRGQDTGQSTDVHTDKEAADAMDELHSLEKRASAGHDASWENHMEIAADPQTQAEAAVKVQSLVRCYLARRFFVNLIKWENRKRLELYAERKASRCSSFYHHVYHEKIKMERERESSSQGVNYVNSDEEHLYFEPRSKAFSAKMCEEVIDRFKNGKRFSLGFANKVLQMFIERARAWETISALGANCDNDSTSLAVVAGDLFGHLYDLFEILSQNGFPSENKVYIFNGNIISNGPNQTECFFLVIVLILAFPDHVRFVRGNHEHAAFAVAFGFTRSCDAYFRPWNKTSMIGEFYERLDKCFRHLTLGVQLFRSGLVIHGGVWRDSKISLKHVKNIDRFNNENVGERHMHLVNNLHKVDLKSISADDCNNAVVQDILWANFSVQADDSNLGFNEGRGISVTYGVHHVEDILDRNSLNLLVSSGSPQNRGYTILEDRHNVNEENTIVKVFSASNYFGSNSNLAAYLLIDVEAAVVPCSFATSRGKRDTHYDYVSNMKNTVRENILALEKGFQKADYDGGGFIDTLSWAYIMTETTGLQIPWLIDRNDIINWDEMELDLTTTESNDARVNYIKLLRDYGLDETKDVRRFAQGKLFMYAQVLHTYFTELILPQKGKSSSSFIEQGEFVQACQTVGAMVHDFKLSSDQSLGGNIYSLLLEKYNLKKFGADSLFHISSGTFWKKQKNGKKKTSLSRPGTGTKH